MVDAPADATKALTLFDVPAQRLVAVAPGSTTTACAHLLVDDPRGWDDSGVVGSVGYTPQDLAAFADPTCRCCRARDRHARQPAS